MARGMVTRLRPMRRRVPDAGRSVVTLAVAALAGAGDKVQRKMGTSNNLVVPAEAGTQSVQVLENTMDWIPACAGMTNF